MQLRSTPKIGVGVITTPNRQINDNIEKFTDPSANLYIYLDKEFKGAAHARNALLSQLSDCDHVFLFDDDCYPVMTGWEQYFIEQAKKHNIGYIVLPEAFKTPLISLNGEMAVWNGGIGCFSYQNQQALKAIGGYNTAYSKYGFEDAGRLFRAIRAGLTGGEYPSCPIRAIAYIHSEDVYAENPNVNYTYEQKQKFIEMNKPIYHAEISGKLYYPFND